LGWSGASRAQNIVEPGKINRTLFRPSARSVGMGGTYLLYINDITGAAFNPAQVGYAGKYSAALEAGVKTDNISGDKINQLVSGLNKFRDALGSSNPPTVDQVRNAFNHLYDLAHDAGARADGTRTGSITAEADPLVGFSFKNAGILAYGGIAAEALMGIGAGSGPNTDKRSLNISAGVLELNTVEVPYAFRVPNGRVGVGLKTVRAAYVGYAAVADASTNSITGASLNESQSWKPDLDVGYLSDPLPLKGLPGIRAAGTIRHLFSPSFSVPVDVRQVVGPPITTASHLDFSLHPEIDVGTLIPYQRLTGVAELHNLTSTNGGDITFHLGGEYRLTRILALRAGYDADRFVGGLGIQTGPVRIDFATATRPLERFSFGISVRM